MHAKCIDMRKKCTKEYRKTVRNKERFLDTNLDPLLLRLEKCGSNADFDLERHLKMSFPDAHP